MNTDFCDCPHSIAEKFLRDKLKDKEEELRQVKLDLVRAEGNVNYFKRELERFKECINDKEKSREY